MDHYRPRMLRPWSLLALALRMVVHLLNHWPLLLIAAFLILPFGPHLRIQYTYIERAGGARSMIECHYLGSRGMVSTSFGDDCPFFAIIDTRKHRSTETSNVDGFPVSAGPSCTGTQTIVCAQTLRARLHASIAGHRGDGSAT